MASFGAMQRGYVGLSNEVKPSLDYTFTGSMFFETDTAKTYIWTGSGWREQFIPVKSSFADGVGNDAFGQKRVSSPTGIFDHKFISSKNSTIWEERLFGCIIVHGAVTGAGFQIGETITGGTSGKTGVITAVGSGNITYTSSDNDFTDTETITGGTSLSTASVTTHDTGAHTQYNYYRSSVYLKTGTITGQRVVRQTIRYFPYVPGCSQRINTTQVFAPLDANKNQYVMLGDDKNGVGIAITGLTVNLIVRSNITGTAVDTIVSQSSWDDPMDGTGASGITLDITKSQIQSIDFQWLGIGRVRFALNIGGISIPIHEISHANVTVGVYMKTPTLPVRYELINVGTASGASNLEQICCSVSSEGGYQLPGMEFSAIKPLTNEKAVTTRVPIMAIRLKNEFPAGQPNRRCMRFLDVEFYARSNDATFELMHVHDTLTMTATWTSVDASSGVEYSLDISALTAKHFHLVQAANLFSGTGNAGNGESINSQFINQHAFISQNFESNNSQMYVIYATSRTGTANCSAHISWLESE